MQILERILSEIDDLIVHSAWPNMNLIEKKEVEDIIRTHMEEVAGVPKEYQEAMAAWRILQTHGIENLAELTEEMEHYNQLKKHEIQYLDNIDDPLEPLKISSALNSEIFKFEYRKEHDPKKISILDYTIIAALVEALEKRTGEENGNG